ncbi:MAG: restriction endonuclease subunit S [Methanobacteriaceae archaeon]|nr:restriction endonuclease subunit S [Methanobacteriaceae archaeon]
MNIPKLRFSEFSGECINKKLEECTIFIRDGTHGSFKDQSNGIPLLSAKDIVSGKIVLNNNPRTISLKDYNSIHKNYEITIDDILLTIVGSIGRSAIVSNNERFTLQRSVAIIRANKEINSLYINYYFHSDNFQKSLIRATNCSAQGGVYLNSLNKMNINLHENAKEQQKITSFLSKVDEKIEKLEKKQELWETYKKGMMQQIFSQKLRFKDGNGHYYVDWETKNLGEISEINTGKKDLKDKISEGKYPFFVRSSNIERINTYSYDGEAILIPGDGRIGAVYHYINGKFDYHQRVYKISDFGENIHGKYIYYYLKHNFLRQAIKHSVKATVDSLRLPTIKGMIIELPTLSEQIKIANFISDIDLKIDKLYEQLKMNKEFKNGLLQQMFC